MKSPAQSPFLRQGATVLAAVGTVLILTYVFDFGIRLFPGQYENLSWQQAFLNELIDRGITPLLGLVFIFVGSLFRMTAGEAGGLPGASGSLVKDGRFWVFVLASLFGLLYLILIPLHFSTTGNILSDAVAQFEQEASRAQQGIEAQQAQLKSIADSGEIDTLIANEQIPAAQKELLEEVKADPSIVEKRGQEELEKINAQKETAVDQANSEAMRARLRSEVRSLLLAFAYAALGWTGLRNVIRG